MKKLIDQKLIRVFSPKRTPAEIKSVIDRAMAEAVKSPLSRKGMLLGVVVGLAWLVGQHDQDPIERILEDN